jgi:hypothetical protein
MAKKESKSLARKKLAFALSQPSKPQSQNVIKAAQKSNIALLKKASPPTLSKKLSSIVGAKQEQTIKKGKAEQTVKTTKETEPFKTKFTQFQESDYERLRDWIEREGLDRDEAEDKMRDAGQPMTQAQENLLNEFESEGVFDLVQEQVDYETQRILA